MFCQNCGNNIPKIVRYCPNCGTEIKNMNGIRKSAIRQMSIKYIWIRIIFVCIFSFILVSICTMLKNKASKNSENIMTEAVAWSDKSVCSSTDEIKTISIVGVWKCKQGEVTFTENGNMMLGKDGIVLGGGWVQYEVVDDKTLYISGGNIPLGMNIKYSLSSKYLTLELSSGNISFTKE